MIVLLDDSFRLHGTLCNAPQPCHRCSCWINTGTQNNRKYCDECNVRKAVETRKRNAAKKKRKALEKPCVNCGKPKGRLFFRCCVECEPIIKRRQNKEYCEAGYKSTEATRKWKKVNPEKHKRQNEKQVARKAHRMKTDLVYRAHRLVTCRIRNMIKSSGGTSSRKGFIRVLGYTPEELADHLRSTLPPDATWDDFLSARLHIDHIRPIASFQINSVDDPAFRECWSLSNLQLLWAKDNMAKGSSWSK